MVQEDDALSGNFVQYFQKPFFFLIEFNLYKAVPQLKCMELQGKEDKQEKNRNQRSKLTETFGSKLGVQGKFKLLA